MKKTHLVPNTLTSLQTILAAHAHLAGGELLLEEHALSKENYLIIREIQSR